jgi:hypothetical protein
MPTDPPFCRRAQVKGVEPDVLDKACEALKRRVDDLMALKLGHGLHCVTAAARPHPLL